MVGHLGRLAAATALAVMIGTLAVSGQSAGAADGRNARFDPPHTKWGDPDLQGHWLPGGGGMMEAPAGEPWKSTIDPGTNSAFSNFFPPEPGAGAAAARPRTPPRP